MSNNENVQPNGQPTLNPTVQQQPAQPTVQPTAQQPVAPQSAPSAQPQQQTEPKAQPAQKADEKTAASNNSNNNKKNKKKKRKTDWGGRLITSILSIIVGFVIGIGSVFGTAAAIVYSIATQPVDETVELVDTITGLDITNLLFNDETGYLSERYLNQKLKIGDLVSEVTDAISGLGGEETSLRDVANISPFVGAKVRELVNMINTDYGIPLDPEALLDAKITGGVNDENALTKTLLENFMNTELGTLIQTLLGESEMNPILKALCYGKEGVDYTIDENGKPEAVDKEKGFITIKDLASEGGEQVLFDLELATLLSITEYNPQDPVHSILFKNELNEDGTPVVGADGKAVKVPVSINDLITDSEAIINGIEIANIVGITAEDDNPLTAILFHENKPYTVGELVEKGETIIGNIEIATILGEEYDQENPSPMDAILFYDGVDGEGNPVKLPVTLDKLDADFINGIKVADILNIGPNDDNTLTSILYKDGENGEKIPVTIDELSTLDLSTISLADVLDLTETTSPVLLSIVFDGAYKLEGEGENKKYVADAENGGKSRNLGELTKDMPTIIDGIKLDSVITVDEKTHPALLSIVYVNGDKSSPRTIGMLSNESNTIINSIKLQDVVGASAHRALQSLFTTTDEKGNQIPTTLFHLTDETESSKLINSIKLEDVMDTSDPILKSIAYDEKGDPRTLNDLASAQNSEKIIKGIKLADVLGVTNSSHKALIFLAYGSATVDTAKARTLGEIRDAGDSLINDIPLSYVITPDLDNTIISYLVYGTKDIHYNVTENDTPEMLQRHIIIKDGKAYNEYGEELKKSASYSFELNSENTQFTENGVVYTLTQGTRTRGKESITVYYLSDNTGNKVMFKEATLKDFSGSNNALTNLTARLTAKDVLGDDIENNAMLKFLKDTPINKLGEAVESLTFGQVFEDQIYRKNKEGEYIDFEGNVVSKEDRILGDIWHYMLTDENGNSAEFEYSIVNDMDKLMENMKREIHDATLERLAHDGIIKFDSETLEAEIITRVGTTPIYFKDPNDTTNTDTDADYKKTADVMFKNADGTAKQTVGKLTVEEIIVYVDGILKTLRDTNTPIS